MAVIHSSRVASVVGLRVSLCGLWRESGKPVEPSRLCEDPTRVTCKHCRGALGLAEQQRAVASRADIMNAIGLMEEMLRGMQRLPSRESR